MEFKSDPSLTRPSNLGWISNLTNTDPAMRRVLLLELACNYGSFVVCRSKASTAAEMVRAPDGYPKRTGTERHRGRQFSISAKLIELAHGGDVGVMLAAPERQDYGKVFNAVRALEFSEAVTRAR